MSPRLTIKIFNKPIHSFHYFGAIGYFAGFILGTCLAYFTELALWPVVLCGLTGAGVLFGLTYLYKIITGGEELVYYQHEIIILICCALVLYLLNLPLLQYLDITLMGIGVFLVFGRIGCFSVGCCHGRPGKNGVKYTEAHVAEGFHRHFVGIPVFPIQLVESAFVLVTVVVGAYAILKGSLPGAALLIYTIIYGTVRFILEYFRGDTGRPYWLGFSEAQWTTLGIFVVSVILSLCNLLPHYTWHLLALPGLVVLMLVTAAARKRRNNPAFKILLPKHILEIAKGLEILENNSFQPNEILVVRTSEDLNISAGKKNLGQNIVLHYTVSFAQGDKKNMQVMNQSTANKLGKLIQILKRFDKPFEILNEQTGIFHILFSLPGERIPTGEKLSEDFKFQPNMEGFLK